MIDRRKRLINFVVGESETDGKRPHPKHLRECLEEIGAIVRQKRVRIYGKDQTIVAAGMGQEELDDLTASNVVRLIDEARAAGAFAGDKSQYLSK